MDRKKLEQGNEAFITKMKELRPDFFDELKKGQTPDYFVLACSDSRSDPDTILSALPGTMFVHRNVANQVVHDDESLTIGLYYAMRVLHVNALLVLGHTGCGGVMAARQGLSNAFLDPWLDHVKENIQGVDQLNADDNQFVRQNIRNQLANLKDHPVYRDIGKGIPIVGALFHLETGEIEWID